MPPLRPSLAIIALVLVTAIAPLASTARAAGTRQVVTGLNLPLFVTHAPGDPYRIYIVEKPGVIKILDLRDPGAGTINFLDITDRVFDATTVPDERGLLGLAFHPDHVNNGYFYVYYINNSGNSQVSRFSRSSADSANPASEQFVLNIAQPQSNHNGGWMAFGPSDGFLYISSGDGGGGGDDDSGHNVLFGNGQDLDTLLGKLLRIDIDGDDFPADAALNYAVPPSNPFVGIFGRDEIWAYGLRNAWRPGFDRQTGDLYIADVGQNIFEEINFQPASSAGGQNYGWRCYEANSAFNTANCPGVGTLTFPFLTYRHNNPVQPPVNANGCSITGGVVYRGCAAPELEGAYFFADYCTGFICSLVYTGASPTPYSDFTNRTAAFIPPVGSLFSIVSFGEDSFGEVYIVVHSTLNGAVYKIVPDAPITDCNQNNILDACEISAGLVPDTNMNAVPDSCDPQCPGNANGDTIVDFDDLTEILANWLNNYAPATGPGDADFDSDVDFDDITTVLENWLDACG
ncbi:MAG TPA: hypothetical protein DEB06_09845 [Phycisphaerales bacterium]|nr:hypothetical protein [Phycisphaerales bacterium]